MKRTPPASRAALRAAGTALAAACIAVGCAGPRIGRTVDARTGTTSRDAQTITAVRTAGPFYERVETSTGDARTSVRPCLYTEINVPGEGASVREYLWPICSVTRRLEHLSWRFLLAFGGDFDTRDPTSAYHVWAFPLWFHGRDRNHRDYAALFPLGGTLRDFLTYDRIGFVLFPLWLRTERYGVHGQSVLWPVFAWSKGEGIRRWRVFPLYGYSRKEGEFTHRFVLWPLGSFATYEREPLAGYEWAVVPLFGRAERGVESSWYLFPPFIQVTLGRGPNQGQRRILAPWPLVRIEDSAGTHKRHFWPLYATRWSDRSLRTDVLWPLFRHTRTRHGQREEEAWSLAPFFHRSVTRAIAGTAPRRPAPGTRSTEGMPETSATHRPPTVVSTYTRVWPLWSRVVREGRSFVRMPDLSLQRRTGALERNLLHPFTLYTRGAQAEPRRVEHDLLWGLLRWGRGDDGYRELRLGPLFSLQHDPTAQRSRWSLLGGIWGRERVGDVRTRRILWFRRAATGPVVPIAQTPDNPQP